MRWNFLRSQWNQALNEWIIIACLRRYNKNNEAYQTKGSSSSGSLVLGSTSLSKQIQQMHPLFHFQDLLQASRHHLHLCLQPWNVSQADLKFLYQGTKCIGIFLLNPINWITISALQSIREMDVNREICEGHD